MATVLPGSEKRTQTNGTGPEMTCRHPLQPLQKSAFKHAVGNGQLVPAGAPHLNEPYSIRR